MKAKYLLPLALTVTLSSPLWADNINPFQGWQAPQTPGQSQSPQLVPTPPVVNMQSQAVQVYTLPDGRYHAEINYQEKADDTRKYTFEGSKDEIRQQLNLSNLPEERKQAVLQALENNSVDLFANALGSSLFGGQDPFGDDFFNKFFQSIPQLQQQFNDPAFQNDPFGDDFFNRFFQNIPQLQQQFNDPAFRNDPFGDDFFNKFFQGFPQLQDPQGGGAGSPLPFPEIEPPAPVKPAFPAQPNGKTEWL